MYVKRAAALVPSPKVKVYRPALLTETISPPLIASTRMLYSSSAPWGDLARKSSK